MMSATGPELVHIEGIAFDGANQSFDDTFGGLLHIRACPNVVIEKCDFTGSSGTAITLDTCGGRLDRNKISGAAGLAAVYSVNATAIAPMVGSWCIVGKSAKTTPSSPATEFQESPRVGAALASGAMGSIYFAPMV
jgi:hypothetical protein